MDLMQKKNIYLLLVKWHKNILVDIIIAILKTDKKVDNVSLSTM